MRSERTLRRMRTFCQTQLNRMNQPWTEDPLSMLGVSEVIREWMQLRSICWTGCSRKRRDRARGKTGSGRGGR